MLQHAHLLVEGVTRAADAWRPDDLKASGVADKATGCAAQGAMMSARTAVALRGIGGRPPVAASLSLLSLPAALAWLMLAWLRSLLVPKLLLPAFSAAVRETVALPRLVA